MHEPAAAPHVDRHIPFKREGWGVAAFIVLLAIASASTAFYIHKTTFREPTDVRMRAAGTERQ
jgi:hypothetical protein